MTLPPDPAEVEAMERELKRIAYWYCSSAQMAWTGPVARHVLTVVIPAAQEKAWDEGWVARGKRRPQVVDIGAQPLPKFVRPNPYRPTPPMPTRTGEAGE